MPDQRQLTPDQIKQLKDSGFSDQQIGEFMFGFNNSATIPIAQALNRIQQGKTALPLGQRRAEPQSTASNWLGAIGAGIGAGVGLSPFGANQVGLLHNAGAQIGRAVGGLFGGQGATTKIGGKPSVPLGRRVGSGIGRGAGGVLGGLIGSTGTRGNTSSTDSGYPGLGEMPTIDYGGMPTAPGPYDYQPPVITPGDFTDLASQIVNSNMAPAIGAYDTLSANAQTQGDRSVAQTAGLYENYLKNIAETKAAGDTEYDKLGADAGQRGQDVQAQMAQNTASSNANVANEAQRLGLQTAAPESLQQAANDLAFAQNQQAQATSGEQNYYDAQQQGRSDYMGSYGNIAESQGLNAQQDLRQNLAQILMEIGTNKANLQSSVGQMATDLAMQMQQQDLAAQTTSAGYNWEGQQAEAQQPWQQYEAEMNAWENGVGQQQQALENYLNWYKTGSDVDQGWAQLGLDRQKAAAGGSSGGGGDVIPTGAIKTLEYAKRVMGPEKASQLITKLNSEYGAWLRSPQALDATSYAERKNRFIQYISGLALAGYDPATVQAVAAQFWNDANTGDQTSGG